MKYNQKNIALATCILVSVAALIVVTAVFIFPGEHRPQQTKTSQKQKASLSERAPTTSLKAPKKSYEGSDIAFGDNVSVHIPNGWRASVSSNPSFIGIQFARPNQIESLAYQPSVAPAIDYDGIPAWGGLTEHFYIRKITLASQAFQPSAHQEVTSESFTFDDGTVGTKYSVTKHATEARSYGGLQKDTEWYGRVYVYQKGDKTIEAHLAHYPSTEIDAAIFETVAKSMKTN